MRLPNFHKHLNELATMMKKPKFNYAIKHIFVYIYPVNVTWRYLISLSFERILTRTHRETELMRF